MVNTVSVVIRVSLNGEWRTANFSRRNCELAPWGGPAGLKRARRMLRRGELISVDIGVDRGDGFPNTLPDGPYWFAAERADFEERVRTLLAQQWSDSRFGREGSVGFVSPTVPPAVAIDPVLLDRLEHPRRPRWWR